MQNQTQTPTLASSNQSHSNRSRSGWTVVLSCTLIAMLVATVLLIVRPAQQSSANVTQLSLPDFASIASGSVVAQTGGLTVMTSEVPGEDILLVLDSRNEELFVYRADNKVGVQLLQRYPVPQLFVDARARTRGGGP